MVSVAHDDRLGRPGWLSRGFEPTNSCLTIAGQSMKIFQHRAARMASLTIGANTENACAISCTGSDSHSTAKIVTSLSGAWSGNPVNGTRNSSCWNFTF
jgi:hypothetical protein